MKSTQKQLLVMKIWLVTKLSIILTNLKRRHEIQDCEDFQRCRKLITEKLAIHLIIDIKTVKAAKLRAKLGFNQVDQIISKPESMGLKIKKLFWVMK